MERLTLFMIGCAFIITIRKLLLENMNDDGSIPVIQRQIRAYSSLFKKIKQKWRKNS